MYGTDDYADEDERRKARGPEIYPTQPPQTAAPGFEGGMGPPASGYGPGGVDNPAYNQTMTPATEMVNQAPPPPTPTPNPSPPQPQFQPATPSSYLPPSGAPQGPAAAQYSTPPITDEVTRMLMARLNELKNPGDVQNDPIYQQAVRANQIAELRSADRQRKSLAERSAAGGTRASGGFNVGVRGIQERSGENTARYNSGLALDRLQAREAQLVEAIKMARAVGQDDIANQLEMQRLQLQAELGRGDLALRGELGRGQLGLGYDNLGLSYADLVMRANRDATLAAL